MIHPTRRCLRPLCQALVLAALFVAGDWLAAVTAGRADEFDPAPVPPAAPVSPAAPDSTRDPDFETEFEILAGAQVFAAGDQADTYGFVPSVGLALSWGMGGETRLVLALSYLWAQGDPYYDTPEFQGGAGTRLRAVPLTLAIRENLARGSRLRFNFSFAVQTIWMEERLPQDAFAGDTPDRDGVGFGILLGAGPEWRSRTGRRALGLEFCWSHSGGRVGKGAASGYDLSLSGIQARLYHVVRI